MKKIPVKHKRKVTKVPVYTTGLPVFETLIEEEKAMRAFKANNYVEKNIEIEALKRELKWYKRWFWGATAVFIIDVSTLVALILQK